MLYFARWKTILVVGIVLLGMTATGPNFFSKESVEQWPDWVPFRQLVLGLDLQGGVYLLYEVDKDDYRDDRFKSLRGEVREALLRGGTGRIGYTGLEIRNNGVNVRVRDSAQIEEARERLEPLVNPLTSSLLAVTGANAVNEFELIDRGNGVFRFEFTEAGFDERIRSIVSQSIEVIRRRIDSFGTTEPSIQREGLDRVLVEAPGVDDPQRLKDRIGTTAKLTFHDVDTSMSAEQALQSRPPPGSVVLPAIEGDFQANYLVEERPILSGEDLADASATFEQQTNEPVVAFRFNTSGGIKFANHTERNVGRPFAIVLDDEVISAPVIREPIREGQGIISGSFTVQSANDLAILLRAGALPAELTIIEERTVGPGMGQDAIDAGRIATIIAAVAVLFFMAATYGVFGIISNTALVANIFILMGVLSSLGATLTLPGIAGIVLTVGMAVDANVLIYERIREEARQGRTPIVAIDAGYRRALSTILDANITTLIAAIILFSMGSGPIRGFAVTLTVGIVTTVFTSFVFSRFLIALWIRARGAPKELPI
ncbi:MAG: protein translocase subunit SecD [Pseudomonadota bacterium]